jgi:hypothetical protein
MTGRGLDGCLRPPLPTGLYSEETSPNVLRPLRYSPGGTAIAVGDSLSGYVFDGSDEPGA